VICGDTDPITFTASSVPGATEYIWTKPSGWSGNSTTNSITLTPDGSSDGDITVQAVSGPYTSGTRTLPISLEDFDPDNEPSISGPSRVACSNEDFVLNNAPNGATVSWQASPASRFANSSGNGTDAILRAISAAGGTATLTYTIDNGPNCPLVTESRTLNLGEPISGTWSNGSSSGSFFTVNFVPSGST
jgi:hypothetical protein